MNRSEFAARLLLILALLIVVGVPVGIHLTERNSLLHARVPEKGGWSQQVIKAQVGVPLKLRMTSDDVIHSFAIGQSDQPAVDIEPGKISEITLNFDRAGIYTFYCTRWCGLNHWRMRDTIEVSGDGPSSTKTSAPPLYQVLGLDIDAPHVAAAIPASIPSAAEGRQIAAARPELKRFLARDYYLAHSPSQLFSELEGTQYSEAERWAVVAEAWRSNTSPEELDEGARLFSQNCAACHGELAGGNGVFAGDLATAGSASTQSMSGAEGMAMQAPADLADPQKILGASPALLQGKILRGGMGTGMPMWGPIFTEAQTWDLIAYLYSLQFSY